MFFIILQSERGAAYNSLTQLIQGGNLIKSIEAFSALRKPGLNRSQILSYIGDIAGSMPITLPGLGGDATFPFRNGVAQIEALHEINRSKNLNIPNIDEYAVPLLRGEYQEMLGMANVKALLEQFNVSEDEFVKNALNYGQSGQWFSQTRFDKYIDQYGATSQNSLGSPASNYRWLNQSGYRSNYNSSSGVGQSPMVFRFDGPLVKIDNIKGGDGVKPEELKEAVAEAVNDTINHLTRTPYWH